MKYALFIAVLLLVGCGTQQERDAEHALHTGEEAYREGNFSEAADAYSKAAFDPRVGYDLGNALYRQQLWDTAVSAFANSSYALPNGPLKADALHNLGNGWMERSFYADSLSAVMGKKAAGVRIEGDDIGMKVRQVVLRDSMQRAVQHLQHLVDSALAQSASAYKSSLRLAPTDDDTRHNLALALYKIAAREKAANEKNGGKNDEDKELSERAKEIMAQADELVEQYKFQEALKVMQDGLKEDPTLKNKQEYMDKLNVVNTAAAAT